MPQRFGIILLFSLLLSELIGQPWVVNDELSTRNGLSQNSGYAIRKDTNGYVWIATQVDVVRYIRGQNVRDLKRFRYSELGWDSNCETTVIEEFGGFLWIGTCNGMARISTKTYEVERIDRSKGMHIRSIARVGKDSFLLGTNKNVFLASLKGNGSVEISMGLLPKPSEIRKILTVNGSHWIGTDSGLYRFKPGQKDQFEKISDFNVLFLLKEADSTIMISVKDKGIYHASIHQTFEIINYCDDITIKNVNVMEKYDEFYWFGTEGGGLVIFDQNLNPANIDRIKDFEKNQVKSLLQSEDGVMWVGTRGNGVKMICSKRQIFSRHYQPEDDGLNPKFYVWSILPHPLNDSLVLVGAEGGLFEYNYINNSKGRTLLPESNKVYCLFPDSLGENVFVGTGRGLIKINLKDTKEIREFSIFNKYKIISLLYKESIIYMGTEKDGLLKYDLNKNKVKKIVIPARGKINVPFLGVGNRGEIIAATDRGAYFIEHSDTARTYSLFEKFNGTKTILCMYQIPGTETYWLGTMGSGLYQVSGEKENEPMKHFHTENGLPDNLIYSILPDQYGSLWISSNRGITRFNPRKESFISFYENDGLQHMEFNRGAYCSIQNRLFFGGLRGFNSFLPLQDSILNYSFKSILTYFRQENDKVIPTEIYLNRHKTDTLVIDFDYDHVEFKVYSSDYQNGNEYNFSFKLERSKDVGVISDTLFASTAFFLANEKHGLKKGLFRTNKFNLEILMADINGDFSQKFELAIIVKPRALGFFPLGWWLVSGGIVVFFLVSLFTEYISINNRFELLRKVGKNLAMANSEKQIQAILEEDLVKTGKLKSVLKSDLMVIFIHNRLDDTLQMIAGYEKNTKLNKSESVFFDPNNLQEQKERPAVWCWNEEWTHQWRDKKGNLIKGEIFANDSPAYLSSKARKVPEPKEGRNSGSMIYQLLELERDEEERDSRRKIGVITIQNFQRNAYRSGVFRWMYSILNRSQRSVVSELLEDLGNSVATALFRVEKIRESDLVETHLRQYRSIMDVHAIPKFINQIETLVDEKDKMVECKFNEQINGLLRSLPVVPTPTVFEKVAEILQISIEDKHKVESFIENVVGFVNTLIYEGEAYITIEKELELAKSYEEIINTIYFGKVAIQIDCTPLPENQAGIYLPSMLIQPLIENSIKHGRFPLHNDNSINILVRVTTGTSEEGEYLFLVVMDNGIGINKRKELAEEERNEAKANPGPFTSEAYKIFGEIGKTTGNTFKYLDKRVEKINEKYGLGKKEKMFYKCLDISNLPELNAGYQQLIPPKPVFNHGTLVIIGIPLNFKFEKNEK